MNNNSKAGVLYSWPIIILALVAFWPVGVFLIIRRVAQDRTAAMSAGKLIGSLGIFSYVLAIIFVINLVNTGLDFGTISQAIFFGVAGFALRKLSKKIVNRAKKVKQYLVLIVNQNVCQLDYIATSTGQTYEVVRADILDMIEKGYFKNAYIDESTRQIVLQHAAWTAPQDYGFQGGSTAAAEPQTRVVTCACCGANNTVVGTIGECEYCGSPIK